MKNKFKINLYIISVSLLIILLSTCGSMILYNKVLALKLLLGIPLILGSTLVIDVIKTSIDKKNKKKINQKSIYLIKKLDSNYKKTEKINCYNIPTNKKKLIRVRKKD